MQNKTAFGSRTRHQDLSFESISKEGFAWWPTYLSKPDNDSSIEFRKLTKDSFKQQRLSKEQIFLTTGYNVQETNRVKSLKREYPSNKKQVASHFMKDEKRNGVSLDFISAFHSLSTNHLEFPSNESIEIVGLMENMSLNERPQAEEANQNDPPQEGEQAEPPQEGGPAEPPQEGEQAEPPQEGGPEEPPQGADLAEPEQPMQAQEANPNNPPQEGGQAGPPQEADLAEPPQEANLAQPPQEAGPAQPPAEQHMDILVDLADQAAVMLLQNIVQPVQHLEPPAEPQAPQAQPQGPPAQYPGPLFQHQGPPPIVPVEVIQFVEFVIEGAIERIETPEERRFRIYRRTLRRMKKKPLKNNYRKIPQFIDLRPPPGSPFEEMSMLELSDFFDSRFAEYDRRCRRKMRSDDEAILNNDDVEDAANDAENAANDVENAANDVENVSNDDNSQAEADNNSNNNEVINENGKRQHDGEDDEDDDDDAKRQRVDDIPSIFAPLSTGYYLSPYSNGVTKRHPRGVDDDMVRAARKRPATDDGDCDEKRRRL